MSILIFGLSTVSPALAQATNAGNPATDWIYTDANSSNWNWSPQTAINTSNVANLYIKWIFPIPSAPAEWANFAPFSANSATGIGATPIVYQGVAYIVTQYWEVFAIKVDTGVLLWSTNLPVYPNQTLSLGHDTGLQTSHFHNSCCALTTNNILGGPTLWVDTIMHHIIALDAFNGTVKEDFADLNLNDCSNGPQNAVLTCTGPYADNYGIQGNLGTYGVKSPALMIDQGRGIMITSALGTSSAASGRGFVRGWDITTNPAKLLWTTYLSPPQDGSNPNWDTQEIAGMTGAWIFNGTGAVNLKTLPASVLNATLYNDWGYIKSPACQAAYGSLSTGGVGEGWGAPWSFDTHTGNFFFNTNNKNPYEGPCVPGPDLWSASILSINDVTGKVNWGFQAIPHDEWDWDCAWNQALANETINGQQTEVLFKSCKSGYVFELNADTGAMIWSWYPSSFMPQCDVCHIFDPLNRTQMTQAFPTADLSPFTSSPGFLGGVENDFSFDPVNNVLVVVQHNDPGYERYVPMNTSNWQTTSGAGGNRAIHYSDNASAFGVDPTTGQSMWSYFIPDIGYRGGVTTSAGVAYLTLSTGYLVTLNDKTGSVLSKMLVGGPLNTLPAIAQSTGGTETVLLPITAGLITFSQSSPPGALVALALAPSSTSGNVVTVTSTASGSSSGGISPSITYAIAAVAVIFIVISGYLAMRGRKPTS